MLMCLDLDLDLKDILVNPTLYGVRDVIVVTGGGVKWTCCLPSI